LKPVTIHPTRVIAGALLLGGGLVIAVSSLAIVLARILVDAGMSARPAETVLLGDLVALLPFIAAFAGANLVAAFGLLSGKTWADALAVGSAIVAITVGSLGLFLVVVGRDPVAPIGSPGSGADGIGILSAFTLVYLVVIVALQAARAPRRITTGVAPA
jgi:hypothetical protein